MRRQNFAGRPSCTRVYSRSALHNTAALEYAFNLFRSATEHSGVQALLDGPAVQTSPSRARWCKKNSARSRGSGDSETSKANTRPSSPPSPYNNLDLENELPGSSTQYTCSYEHCPRPNYSSANWKMVNSDTNAGGQEWSHLKGRVFCHACWTQFRTKGTFERLYSLPKPASDSPPEPELAIVMDAPVKKRIRDEVVHADEMHVPGCRAMKRTRARTELSDWVCPEERISWQQSHADWCATAETDSQDEDDVVCTGIPPGRRPSSHVYLSIPWRKELEANWRQRFETQQQHLKEQMHVESTKAAKFRKESLRSANSPLSSPRTPANNGDSTHSPSVRYRALDVGDCSLGKSQVGDDSVRVRCGG